MSAFECLSWGGPEHRSSSISTEDEWDSGKLKVVVLTF